MTTLVEERGWRHHDLCSPKDWQWQSWSTTPHTRWPLSPKIEPSILELREVALYLRGAVCAQLCLRLCDPMDCSLPGSSVHGVSQVTRLEWVAISCSRGMSQPRGHSHISWVSCIAGQIPYHQHHLGSPTEEMGLRQKIVHILDKVEKDRFYLCSIKNIRMPPTGAPPSDLWPGNLAQCSCPGRARGDD